MTPRDVLQRCPLCQAVYAQEAVVCLEQGFSGKPRLFHCACGECKRSMIALLLETTGWLSSVGMLTELTAHEARRMHECPPIAADHCVRTYKMLEESSIELCGFLLKQAENTSKGRS